VDRFSITLRKVERDIDGDDVYFDVIDATGSASVCRAVLAEIASELGASGLQMTLGYGDTATAGERLPDAVESGPERSALNDEQINDALDGKPRRTRRTKAQIEADRLAEARAAAGNGAAAVTVPDGAMVEPTQPVDAPAPVVVPGNFGPGQPAAPAAPPVAPAAGGPVYNPFDPNRK
jgi:hypothetical protein